MFVKRAWRAGLASGVAGCVMSAGMAAAQENAVVGLEEIVVTATKRETFLQRTPVAVTAISGAQLDFLDARDFNAYARRVPGLNAIDQGAGRKRYIIRGINAEDSNRSQSTVAQYVDEVAITNSFGQQPDPRLVDVERVEVLRGPQGTTFGARSMSGAIRTITRKPVMDRVEGNAQLQGSFTKFGGFNSNVEAVVNVPVVRNVLALRAAAFYARDEGYVDNIFAGGTFTAQPNQVPPGIPVPPPRVIAPIDEENYSDVRFYGMRLMARWTPTDRLTVDAMGLVQDGKVAGPSFYSVQATGDETRGLVMQLIGAGANDDDLTIGTLTAAYDFDVATLTAVGSFSNRNNSAPAMAAVTGTLDNNGPGSTRAFGNDITGRTIEVRLASNTEQKLQWLVGGYAFWAQNNGLTRDFLGFTNFLQNHAINYGDGKEKAAFGELSYAVTERFNVSAGLRWSDYFDTQQRYIVVSPGNVFPPGLGIRESFSEETVTWKFDADYQATDNVFVYAVAAQGFRPGGFNPAPPPSVTNFPGSFASDGLWSYELGAKTAWLENRLVANGALYKVDWSNMQALSYTAGVGTMLIPFVANVGSADIIGAEFEVTARPLENLSIDLALNHFLRARLSSDMPPSANGLRPLNGDPLPNNSKWSFNLGGEYRQPVGGGLDGFVRLDWSFTDRRTTGFRPTLTSGAINNAYNSLAPYGTVDARIGISAREWRATFFVENIFDARPAINQQNFAPLPVTIRTTRKPRTMGVSMRREW
jgi:iron complex outermembrane recepter protein